ncbi:uncharacterized protein METZ01_LOCUS515913 [marine metagenome]|uniref:Uncharacterized protein n=1 Tax=marine metagenome TaxID=408172 RepID=A0A383F286_9ZZZZ
MSKVSVIVPAFNKYNFTRKTIISIINQTYKEIEIILIDDGSNDDTYKLKHEFKNSIKYYYTELLDLGVAKEQARVLLPIAAYTEVYWTASFQAIVNFIELRDEPTAQYEIRQYAIAFKKLLSILYPKTTEIWSDLYWKKYD